MHRHERKTLDDLDVERIKAVWFDMEFSLRDIATELKTSHVTLRRIAERDLGLPNRADLREKFLEMSETDQKAVRKIHEENPTLSDSAIARRINVRQSSVERFRKKHGLMRVQPVTKDGCRSLEDQVLDLIARDVPSEKIVAEVGCKLEDVFRIDEKYTYAEAA